QEISSLIVSGAFVVSAEEDVGDRAGEAIACGLAETALRPGSLRVSPSDPTVGCAKAFALTPFDTAGTATDLATDLLVISKCLLNALVT
ncbi:hypothetical protein THAOC_36842, partial [Thalassiosira oceanica]